jgi:hypothetical protein
MSHTRVSRNKTRNSGSRVQTDSGGGFQEDLAWVSYAKKSESRPKAGQEAASTEREIGWRQISFTGPFVCPGGIFDYVESVYRDDADSRVEGDFNISGSVGIWSCGSVITEELRFNQRRTYATNDVCLLDGNARFHRSLGGSLCRKNVERYAESDGAYVVFIQGRHG